MNKISKAMTGAAAAALMTITAAAPAQAQYYEPQDRGISTRDVITGAVVVGGIVAAVSALGRGNDRYDNRYYDNRGYGAYGNSYGNSRYGGGIEQRAVNSCAYEAQRRYQRQGNARILQVSHLEPRRNDIRVHGVMEVQDHRYHNRGYNNRGYAQRVGFTCTTRLDGRVSNFRTNNNYAYR
jgi:hypothetical protein